jgi:hypothetical protein
MNKSILNITLHKNYDKSILFTNTINNLSSVFNFNNSKIKFTLVSTDYNNPKVRKNSSLLNYVNDIDDKVINQLPDDSIKVLSNTEVVIDFDKKWINQLTDPKYYFYLSLVPTNHDLNDKELLVARGILVISNSTNNFNPSEYNLNDIPNPPFIENGNTTIKILPITITDNTIVSTNMLWEVVEW